MQFTNLLIKNSVLLLSVSSFLFSCSGNSDDDRPSQNFQRPQQQQRPYYYPPQQQQAPYQQRPAPYGQVPGSRYYSNPYDIPAYGNYRGNAYYDSDQYYQPPTQYQNVERPQFINNGSTPF